MKFVLSQSVVPEALALLSGHEVRVLDTLDMSERPADIADADAMIIRISRVCAEAVGAAPKLRVIGRTGVGFDSIDVAAATARGIPVVLAPGASSRSVAEHTVAMIYALSKNLAESHCELLKGNYGIRGRGAAFELLGRTVLVLGLGSIGSEVARLCKANGLRVIGYTPSLTDERAAALDIERVRDFRAALPACDFVTLHMPLTKTTRNMIGEAEIALMKPTAMIVNCARGGIVNEKALTAALNEGRLAGAGIDCFEHDPPDADDPLLNARNVIASPHSAALSKEAAVRTQKLCLEGCLAVLRGEKWPFVADQRVYEHPVWQNR